MIFLTFLVFFIDLYKENIKDLKKNNELKKIYQEKINLASVKTKVKSNNVYTTGNQENYKDKNF